MKNIRIIFLATILILGITTFTSCDKDEDSQLEDIQQEEIKKEEDNNEGIISDKINGVVINGVCWATSNVDIPYPFDDSNPEHVGKDLRRFAENPEDAGAFFQWNSQEALSYIGDIGNWYYPELVGTTWENDPSPAGWRVPTETEIYSLFDSKKVKKEWTSLNGVNGVRFTDIASGKSIFLPAAGICSFANMKRHTSKYGSYWSCTTMVIGSGSYCHYWSSYNDANAVFYMSIINAPIVASTQYARGSNGTIIIDGYNIRSVAK